MYTAFHFNKHFNSWKIIVFNIYKWYIGLILYDKSCSNKVWFSNWKHDIWKSKIYQFYCRYNRLFLTRIAERKLLCTQPLRQQCTYHSTMVTFLRAIAINMYAIYTHAKASCVYFVKIDKILTISNFVILTMHTLMLLADVLVARMPFSVTRVQTYFIWIWFYLTFSSLKLIELMK